MADDMSVEDGWVFEGARSVCTVRTAALLQTAVVQVWVY